MPVRPYLHLIQRLGVLDFTRIAIERMLDRVTGGAASRRLFDRAMRKGHVYFGEHLGARQGVPARHDFMSRLARQELERREAEGACGFRIVEAGSYAGGSAITWALALKSSGRNHSEVVCVDPWRNYLTDRDIDASATPDVLRTMAFALQEDRIFRLFQHNVRAAGVSDIVRTVRERFSDGVSLLEPRSCDIVFVDANHRYTAVSKDLMAGALLVRDGGILCGDDLEVQWPQVDPEFCAARSEVDWMVDPRARQFVHPGVTKAVWDFFGGEVSSWNGFWAMRRQGDGWQKVALQVRPGGTSRPPHFRWWAPLKS